jgi:hypothetical protein
MLTGQLHDHHAAAVVTELDTLDHRESWQVEQKSSVLHARGLLTGWLQHQPVSKGREPFYVSATRSPRTAESR